MTNDTTNEGTARRPEDDDEALIDRPVVAGTAPDGHLERAVSELSYSEAAAELDRIIDELDRGSVDLDRLETALERAVEITEELDRRIRGVRARVDALVPRLEAAGGEAPGGTQA
jgi:exodeoxyribonuclease VII small subunit